MAATKTAKAKRLTTAYWVVNVTGGWGVGCVVETEPGYHPVDDYGPYNGREGKARAQGIVDRLNERLGHGEVGTYGHLASVRAVVGASMKVAKASDKKAVRA